MTPDLKPLLSNTALAFRGYNITNLGRSHELLKDDRYGSTVRAYLYEASEVCSDVTGREVNLVTRVEQQQEAELGEYSEAIALIVAMEQAQLKLLSEFHGIDYRDARFSLGFSLGEISALVAGGVYTMADALRIPLAMADDCAALARDVKMGIVFSKSDIIPLDPVRELCLDINAKGTGVIGISTYLSPNSFLILGSGDTVKRFRAHLRDILPDRLHLRLNNHRWPPLHTPIVWQKSIPNRASVLLHTLPGGRVAPDPDVLSMVTGSTSYTAYNSRDVIAQWIDHPQRLWDVVNVLLQTGIETLVHIGPAPNIIPATFERLAGNVDAQTRASRRMRAVSAVARRPWLQALLPRRAALLRAPLMRHVVLEDWLLNGLPDAFCPTNSDAIA